MRRLRYQVAVSLDGFIAGPRGEYDWIVMDPAVDFAALLKDFDTAIMGRKTYESIGRLLPWRTSVIVTRQHEYVVPGALIAHTLADAIATCCDDSECFVIGGAELFREALTMADRLYLTVVDAEPPGDTFMPELDLNAWREVRSETFSADEKHAHAYTFFEYERLR